jgi:hypothetical protein
MAALKDTIWAKGDGFAVIAQKVFEQVVDVPQRATKKAGDSTGGRSRDQNGASVIGNCPVQHEDAISVMGL